MRYRTMAALAVHRMCCSMGTAAVAVVEDVRRVHDGASHPKLCVDPDRRCASSGSEGSTPTVDLIWLQAIGRIAD